MKRFVLVLVALMVLTLMPWGESYCDIHPQSYYDLFRPGGDDHPWGGEQYVEPGLSVASAPAPTTPITGILIVDVTLRIFLEYSSPGDYDGTVVYDKGLPSVEPRPVIESSDEPATIERGNAQ
jgi:hypothetical protein